MGGMGGGGGGGASNMGSDPNFDIYGGIDPEMDPELAHAIRVSTEEARAQEEARAKAAQDAEGPSAMDTSDAGADANTSSAADTSSANLSQPVPFGGFEPAYEEDEEALMQRALEMSMRDMEMSTGDNEGGATQGGFGMDMDEEESLKQALALSTGAVPPPPPSSSSTSTLPPAPPAGAGVVDSAFVSQLLGGVDQSDPLVAAALAQLGGAQTEEKKEEGKKDKDEGTGNKRKGDDV